MKYLKKFDTHTEYETYINNSDKILPNVSYCDDNNEVHYNPIVPETRLVVKYNVTDTSSETTLLVNTTPFIDMEIDSVTQPGVVSSYAFNTLGIHTVKYTLVDPTTIGCYYDEIDYLSYFDGTPTTEVIIPSSVTSIGDYAFAYCTNLTSITIPNSVTSIGQEAFINCGDLTSVTIPNGVTSISYSTFDSCSGLISITIPNSITSIGNNAFRNTSSLVSVTVEATTPPTLGTYVFTNNPSGRKIYVPSESVNAYKTATNWSNYAADIEAIQ